MVACDGHYSDPEKTIEERSEKHTLEAELFAQLLDNTKMFCLIWTLIWCEFVQLDTLAEIYVVGYVWPCDSVSLSQRSCCV